MPPKKIIEYTVFIIDCRFEIDKKLDQLYSIFSTKVFKRTTKIKSVDRQQIILTNSSVNNSIEQLNEWSFYHLNHLKETRKACVADEQEKPVNHNNILKAINLAISSLIEVEDKKNILVKKIIVLTDLLTPINPREELLKNLKSGLKSCDATLYFIGVDCAKIPKLGKKRDIKGLFNLEYLETFGEIEPRMKDNFNVLRKLSDRNILVLNYEDGFHLLFAYKPKIKDPYPWYVNLGIGTDLRIPVLCHKTIRKHVNVKSRRAPLVPGENYCTDKGWFDLNTHEEVPLEDVVRGYRFHGKFVTFTPEQMDEMKSKKKTNKCLSVVAFVDADKIPLNLYAYENSMNKVKPDRRSTRGNLRGFRMFVAGMRARNVVAIVKRVYNNGFRPNLFAIFPCSEHKTNNYMLMCQVPYAHQFKDRYHRGEEYKLEETDPKIQQDVYNFLDKLVADTYPSGQPIMPLTENLKCNMNRQRQYKFFAKKSLAEDPGNPPELSIHPYLEDQAEEFAENLLEYLEE